MNSYEKMAAMQEMKANSAQTPKNVSPTLFWPESRLIDPEVMKNPAPIRKMMAATAAHFISTSAIT